MSESDYQYAEKFGRKFRVKVWGKGIFIGIDKEVSPDEWVDSFHSQGDGTEEFVDLLDEHGFEKLLEYLDGAGVEL